MPHRCRLLSSAAAAVAASGGRQPTTATYGLRCCQNGTQQEGSDDLWPDADDIDSWMVEPLCSVSPALDTSARRNAACSMASMKWNTPDRWEPCAADHGTTASALSSPPAHRPPSPSTRPLSAAGSSPQAATTMEVTTPMSPDLLPVDANLFRTAPNLLRSIRTRRCFSIKRSVTDDPTVAMTTPSPPADTVLLTSPCRTQRLSVGMLRRPRA